MTKRGDFSTVGGSKRLRFVKSGYSVDDPNVPTNAVIFDSDVDGMASILEVGDAEVPLVTTGAWLRQWDYSFVPLCIFSFPDSVGQYWDFTQECTMMGGVSWAMTQQRITVSKQGIWVRRGTDSLSGYRSLKIRWVALRVDAHG